VPPFALWKIYILLDIYPPGTSFVSAPVVPTRSTGGCPMMDLLMLALGLGFFALSIAYTYACDQL
jgi:hypothetical protein